MRKNVLFTILFLFCVSLSFSASKSTKITTKGIAEGLAVHSIIQDDSGLMWLATETGLCSYDGYELRLFQSKRIGMVNLMEIDGDTLLIGGTKGLLKFLLKEKKFVDESTFTGEIVRAKANDWIGTDKALYHKGQKIGSLTDIYDISPIDDDIFVGTINSLYKIKGDQEDLLLDNCLFVGQIVDLGDEFAIGSAKSLIFLDKNTLKVNWQTDVPVAKTMLHRDSITLIGTDEGLYTINDKKEIRKYNHNTSLPTMSLAGDVVWCIYADNDQNIWIGTDNGVSIIYHKPVIEWMYISEIAESTQGNHIDCVLEDSRGRLWLGGTNGIICVDDFKTYDQKSRWYKMGEPKSHITHNRIRDIYEDSSGRIWVCTDGGLFLYDETTHQMGNITVRNSGPTWTYSISQDAEHNLRVEMSDSIYTLDFMSLGVVSQEAKTQSDKKKALYRDALGRKWFASKQGDLVYTGGIDKVGFSTRQRLLEDSISKSISVTSVAVNGKGYVDDTQVTNRNIVLNYDENSISVSFSDFIYDNEHLKQYYYLIDGLKKEWIPIPVGENKIIISYLPYGRYNIFISSSQDKTSSPQLSIRISPPWYLSLPMVILYIILFLLLIVAIIIYFVQRKTIRLEKEQKAIVIEKAKQKENMLQQELVVTAKNKEATADTVASDDSLLRKITKIIEENMENPEFSPSVLSEILDVNQKQVYRKIKFLTGMTTVEYIRHIRLDHAASLLCSGNFTIAEVMYRVGFSNASYFSRSFLSQHGLTPTDYKKNQASLCVKS